jgi:hypothetical protein
LVIVIVIRSGVFFFLVAIPYDKGCLYTLFMEACCDGGNHGVRGCHEVIQIMVLHLPSPSRVATSRNPLDEASKETSFH